MLNYKTFLRPFKYHLEWYLMPTSRPYWQKDRKYNQCGFDEENSDYPEHSELCSVLQKCYFLSWFCTCGLWVNVGEVLVTLQFDFIKDVHLLLCRERTIKSHLWSTTNKIRSSVTMDLLHLCERVNHPLPLEKSWQQKQRQRATFYLTFFILIFAYFKCKIQQLIFHHYREGYCCFSPLMLVGSLSILQ